MSPPLGGILVKELAYRKCTAYSIGQEYRRISYSSYKNVKSAKGTKVNECHIQGYYNLYQFLLRPGHTLLWTLLRNYLPLEDLTLFW